MNKRMLPDLSFGEAVALVLDSQASRIRKLEARIRQLETDLSDASRWIETGRLECQRLRADGGRE